MSNSDKVVVARLGGECVTAGELVDWLRVTERRSVVRDLLADRLVRRQALRAGWETSPEELQAAVDSLRRRHKLYRAAEMHQWLAERGLSVEDLEEQTELQILRLRIRNDVAGAETVEREFIENRREHDRVRLSRIVVAEAGVADEIRLQLDEGGDFGVLAQRYSTDLASRGVGGDLGVVPRTSLPAAVESAVFSARPGEIVGPVSTPQGYQLLRIQQLLPGELTTDVAEAIRERLFQSWVDRQLVVEQCSLVLGAGT